MKTNVPSLKNIFLLTLLSVLFNHAAIAQLKVALTDGKHVIKLKKNLPIANMTDKDTVKLSLYHQKKENETIRYGTIFKTEKITDFDTVSIVGERTTIDLKSLRSIYVNDPHLELKFFGGAIAMVGLYMVLHTI